MKNRRACWLGLLIAVLVGTVWWLALPTEPSHQGRSLSAWLNDLTGPPMAQRIRKPTRPVRAPGSPVMPMGGGFTTSTPADRERAVAARQALQAMGTNALPHLLARLDATDSAMRKRLLALAGRQSLLPIYFRSETERRMQAAAGICAIGRPAIPAMEGLLEEKLYAVQAVYGLSQVGAVDSLMKALTNGNKLARDVAVTSIGRFTSEAPRLVPTLIQQLSDPDPVHRRHAAMVLGQFGAAATPAVRPLVRMLADNETNARRAAEAALRQIDLEAEEGRATP